MESVNKNEAKNDILNRLKRIEGQVKGLQRMLDEEKCCSDVLVQVAAVKAAINKVGILVFEEHSKTCLKDHLKEEDSPVLDDLIDIMKKFIR